MLPHYLAKIVKWIDEEIAATRQFSRYFTDYEQVRVPDYPVANPKEAVPMRMTDRVLKIGTTPRIFLYQQDYAFSFITIVIITYDNQHSMGMVLNLYSNLKRLYPSHHVVIWDWNEKHLSTRIFDSLLINENRVEKVKAAYAKILKSSGLEHLNPYKKPRKK